MLDLIPKKRQMRQPDIFREMENMFRHFWHDFPVVWEGGADIAGTWTPNLDVSETDKAIEVRAELPGLDKKDIDISLDRNILTIRGEKRQEKEESGKRYHLLERSYGSFLRTIRLPTEVDEKKLEATFKDGVLKVTLPKTEESQKKVTHIEIH